MEMNEAIRKVIPQQVWEAWGAEQQAHVLARQGQPVTRGDYAGKHWDLGEARPTYGEICARCSFPYCFYARPRNWSLSHSADVYNLMRCASASCQHEFESCL